MFARKKNPPQTPETAEALELIAAGDVPGALRLVRGREEELPTGELAGLLSRAAAATGFEDLEQAAGRAAADPEHPQMLYAYGYACIERGLPAAAVPALRRALELVPESGAVLRELVAAYEETGRHDRAAAVLETREESLADWPDRYLLAWNAAMSGRLDVARHQTALLSAPDDERWQPAHRRMQDIVRRAEVLRVAAAPVPTPLLGEQDLRGWQFVIAGTVLGTLSPYGFDAGMNGRWAWLQDSPEQCREGLLRLRTALSAADLHPTTVSLLPDRSSRILGLAAAELLGLPAVPFEPARTDTVVIAYDLSEVDAESLIALRDRTPGQVLHEHASCWTDTPPIAPDSAALLVQSVVPPWGSGLRMGEDGAPERMPEDSRPVEEIAADIVGADAVLPDGDDEAPEDDDEAFVAFVRAAAAHWLQGDRTQVPSSGPVPGARFV
ncbi:tetratricopeptide repeat protein [Streptomyces sp. ET3-23]|uniref:tetratricopeptide repeat protein n=1 Tax=Streptomyces sp. ET3-23 TaxID=2885643 RepID=UPI001D12970D|nr:tetratricopeptide repeat protein [Streptomyces sp. ET3-23]MCC2280362.1 tetratricopeptide repeat protein [Streptomyces sp. ET3-23]